MQPDTMPFPAEPRSAQTKGLARRSVLFFAPLLLLLGLPVACGGAADGPDGPDPDAAPPTVVATVFADLSLATMLAGDAIDPRPLAPAGTNPIDWTPTAEDIAQLQQADLILLHGAGAEPWRSTASLPESRVFVVAEGLGDRVIRKESVTHSHGPGGDHTHEGGADPHTWMDPALAKMHLQRIAARLTELVPHAAERIAGNSERIRGELDGIAAALDALPKPPEGLWIYGASPGYGYLARRLGWSLQERHMNPDGDLGDPTNEHEIQHAIMDLADKKAHAMLWAREPEAEVRRVLEKTGFPIHIVRTGATAPEAGDLVAMMKVNTSVLRSMLADG